MVGVAARRRGGRRPAGRRGPRPPGRSPQRGSPSGRSSPRCESTPCPPPRRITGGGIGRGLTGGAFRPGILPLHRQGLLRPEKPLRQKAQLHTGNPQQHGPGPRRSPPGPAPHAPARQACSFYGGVPYPSPLSPDGLRCLTPLLYHSLPGFPTADAQKRPPWERGLFWKRSAGRRQACRVACGAKMPVCSGRPKRQLTSPGWSASVSSPVQTGR